MYLQDKEQAAQSVPRNRNQVDKRCRPRLFLPRNRSQQGSPRLARGAHRSYTGILVCTEVAWENQLDSTSPRRMGHRSQRR